MASARTVGAPIDDGPPSESALAHPPSTSRSGAGPFVSVPQRTSSLAGAATARQRRTGKLPAAPSFEMTGLPSASAEASGSRAPVRFDPPRVPFERALQVEREREYAFGVQTAMLAEDARTMVAINLLLWKGKLHIPDASAIAAIQGQGLSLAVLSTWGFNLNNNWAMRIAAEPLMEELAKHMAPSPAALIAYSIGAVSGALMAGHGAALMSAVVAPGAVGLWQKAFGAHEVVKRDIRLAVPPASGFLPGSGSAMQSVQASPADDRRPGEHEEGMSAARPTKTMQAYEADSRAVELARGKMETRQGARRLDTWTTHMVIWLSFSVFNAARLGTKPDPSQWEDALGVMAVTIPAAWIAMALITHWQWTDSVTVQDQSGRERSIKVNEVRLIDPGDKSVFAARFYRGFDGFFNGRRGVEAGLYFFQESLGLSKSVYKANQAMPLLQAGLAMTLPVLKQAEAAGIAGARQAIAAAKITVIVAHFAFALWPLLLEFVAKAGNRKPPTRPEPSGAADSLVAMPAATNEPAPAYPGDSPHAARPSDDIV